MKDIQVSYDFYQALGFTKIMGEIEQKWLILKQENNGTVIGIFQGHFPAPFMQTYNPLDVRAVQAQLKARGIKFEVEAEPGTSPAHAFIKDPDGNSILLDQH